MELRELKEEAGDLWSAGKFAQAEVLYRQMLLLNPRDGQLWVRHAEALRRLGREGDAVASYRRASQMLADEGHLPRAIASLRMALELRPEDIDLIAELIRAETRRTRARPRPVPARSETPAALLALPVLEEAVTNPGITIEVEPNSLDWPQVRRLSVRSLAIKTSPEAQWMILESADPIRLSFADELPEANDQEPHVTRTALLAAVLASTAFASERSFGFLVTGPTIAEGTKEVIGAVGPRLGRYKDYTRLDNQLGFGQNFRPRVDVQVLLAFSLSNTGLEGRSAEAEVRTRWRWQPLESASDVVGLALIGTVGAGPDTVTFEGRVGLEKWVGDFLFAANVSADYQARRDGADGATLHLEQAAGIAWRLPNGFTASFELRDRLGFERGSFYGAAVYLGPTFGWKAKRWWVSVALLPQVMSVKAAAVVGDGEALELRDNERFNVQLAAGFDVP